MRGIISRHHEYVIPASIFPCPKFTFQRDLILTQYSHMAKAMESTWSLAGSDPLFVRRWSNPATEFHNLSHDVPLLHSRALPIPKSVSCALLNPCEHTSEFWKRSFPIVTQNWVYSRLFYSIQFPHRCEEGMPRKPMRSTVQTKGQGEKVLSRMSKVSLPCKLVSMRFHVFHRSWCWWS